MNTIVSDTSARSVLQAAWDGCNTLPPIIFTDSEADAILASLPSPEGEWVLVPREASNLLGAAMQAVEGIGIVTAGCSQTHGDLGGGLEMANGYASDAFQNLAKIAAMLSATPSFDGERGK